MGIYDRDYVRREGRSVFGPMLERGTVCKSIIFSTVGIFILLMLAPPLILYLVLTLDGIQAGQVWRLLTYPFVYSPMSPWPILWDMLFLWWFGRDLEDIYGPKEFLGFWIAVVLVSAGVYLLIPLAAGLSITPMPLFGASDAVLAVLVLAALHFPRRIINLFFILPVPIWLVALVDVALHMYNFLAMLRPGQAVAALAGVPGAFLAAAGFALLYYKNQWRVSTLWPDFSAWRRRRNRPRLRLHTEEDEPVTPVPVAPSGVPAEAEELEAKMDAILEKISRSGKESLTDSERQVLLQASEIIRRRRS
jgi:membrane associated rhomboid family serine protease